MQVLHAIWLMPRSAGENAGLFVWAETSSAPQPTRDRRKKSAQRHPFLVAQDELAAALRETAPGPLRSLHRLNLTLHLPTNKFGPVPSPDLMHEWPEDTTGPELLPWSVEGAWLETKDAFNLLALLTRAQERGIRLGGDLRYWLNATDLVLEILAQQKLRPVILEIPGARENRYEARWQPLLDSEEDARRLIQLAAAMPPAARCAAADPNDADAPQALLDSFLNHMSDAGARAWGSERLGRLPAGSSPATRWLNALFAAKPTIDGSAAQLQHLYDSYRAWTRTLTIAGDKQYRVAFRLEAPPPQARTADWHLHYLLQARGDASLIVPASEVWESGSGMLGALGRRFDRPQERLLAGLGYPHASLRQSSAACRRDLPAAPGSPLTRRSISCATARRSWNAADSASSRRPGGISRERAWAYACGWTAGQACRGVRR